MLAIAVAISATLASVGTFKLTKFAYEAEITAINSAHQAALIEQQQKTMKLVAHRETRANEVATDYENKMDGLQRRYAAEFDELRRTAEQARSDEQLPVPPGSGECPKAACTNRLSFRAQERLIALVQQADEQTQRLIACQNWAKSLQEKVE